MADGPLSVGPSIWHPAVFGGGPITPPGIPTDAMHFSIDTALGDGVESFRLPLPTGYAYNFTVDWGDGKQDSITSATDPLITHAYISPGQYDIYLWGVCEGWSFFNTGDKDKLTRIRKYGNVGLGNLAGAFYGCGNLTTPLPIDGAVLSQNTTLENAFRECNSPGFSGVNISSMDTPSVVSTAAMFKDCTQMQSFSAVGINMMGVTSIDDMFDGCTALTSLDVSDFDVRSVTSAIGFATGVAMGTANLDAAYTKWAQLPVQDNVTIDMGVSQYTPGGAAEAGRNYLINVHNWTILDGGPITTPPFLLLTVGNDGESGPFLLLTVGNDA